MTIRVLLDASTSMIRSALQATLDECDDIELVINDPADQDPAIDVVVLQQRLLRNLPAALGAIVDAPQIGVVAIGDDGQAGDLYRIDRRGWHFAPDGLHGLADAIRAAASAG